jgi:hypothetical protein
MHRVLPPAQANAFCEDYALNKESRCDGQGMTGKITSVLAFPELVSKQHTWIWHGLQSRSSIRAKPKGRPHKEMQTRGFAGKSGLQGTAGQWRPNSLALFLYVIALACLVVSQPAFAHQGIQTFSAGMISQSIDPNKALSELNHHIAGWALIGVGVLVLTNLLSLRLKPHSYIWPALFILAGLFLALWSDGEIWPRGNLGWSWLLQHDAEARQHKIYSLLLIAIGVVEYIRIRGTLPRLWKSVAFPLIAVAGASLLLIHDHSAGSGVRSPEAQAYLVNPDLDVDGNRRGLSLSTTPAPDTDDQHRHMHHSPASVSDTSIMDAGNMPADHSQMAMDFSPASTVPSSHQHHMTASMIRVERQHLWFMIVGIAIGLFKFISDSEFFRSRIVHGIWPSCMVLLGLMLVIYRE